MSVVGFLSHNYPSCPELLVFYHSSVAGSLDEVRATGGEDLPGGTWRRSGEAGRRSGGGRDDGREPGGCRANGRRSGRRIELRGMQARVC